MKIFSGKFLQGDKTIWMVIFSTFIISTIAVYSSVNTLANNEVSEWDLFTRHFTFQLIGLAAVWLTHKIPIKMLAPMAKTLYHISIVLLIITFFMKTTNSAARWFYVPGTNLAFQTSDVAKFSLIIYLAQILALNQKNKEKLKASVKPMLIAIITICALILPANYSTAALLAMTSIALLFVGRVELKTVGLMLAGAFVALLIILVIAFNTDNVARGDTWHKRITSFFSDEVEEPDQVKQAKIAVATGWPIGRGPGNSLQRNVLENAYSDFIYAIIVEEYGLIGAFVIIALYLALLYRAGVIVKKCKRTFAAFLVIGLTVNMVFQAFTNMAVTVNLLPVTGQPLPLISWGGTSMLFTSISLGFILSVSRQYDTACLEDSEEEQEEDWEEYYMKINPEGYNH